MGLKWINSNLTKVHDKAEKLGLKIMFLQIKKPMPFSLYHARRRKKRGWGELELGGAEWSSEEGGLMLSFGSEEITVPIYILTHSK